MIKKNHVEAFFNEMPFAEFLNAAASRSHVPGGGSVAASAGALGASMGAMVARLTLGKEGYEACQEQTESLAQSFTAAVAGFQRLAGEDMLAFDALMAALRMPKSEPEEIAARDAATGEAAYRAIDVPLQMGQLASRLLAENERLASFANAGAVSDCAVAAIILEAAARASLVSVDVNLPLVRDNRRRGLALEAQKQILKGLPDAVERTLATVKARTR
ncbi:MAG: cyclodeaminase/cyclohydrolase family protein [Deltaproteobacteria bacterium]|jgi:formiminotetrahydrofolate cyclodeaminase|nr:cyclodeaminase/cyclohydrolase family protein [Deltaproteobacteria bacterium]